MLLSSVKLCSAIRCLSQTSSPFTLQIPRSTLLFLSLQQEVQVSQPPASQALPSGLAFSSLLSRLSCGSGCAYGDRTQRNGTRESSGCFKVMGDKGPVSWRTRPGSSSRLLLFALRCMPHLSLMSWALGNRHIVYSRRLLCLIAYKMGDTRQRQVVHSQSWNELPR